MSEFTPNIVLAVAAHADDNEFCFGGSIAKWVKDGATVHYLVVTDGHRGTEKHTDDKDSLIATRQKEQDKAAEILGVTDVQNLLYEDGRLDLTWELRRDITKAIRIVKPDTVLCMDPQFLYSTAYSYANHNDHRVVGQATFDSVYPLARDETAYHELKDISPHKVKNLLMYNLDKQDSYIDISSTIDTKAEAIKAHASQFGDGEAIEKAVRGFASSCTKDIELAEGFVHLTIS